MNPTTVETLKKLRSFASLSQDQMAGLLGISRLTYLSIETGKRELKESEIKKIAEIFEISTEDLMGNSNKQGVPSLPINSSHTKMMNVILYILSKCAGKPNVGKIVLNKLLYFSDFNYYEKYKSSITGERYIKMPMGPVPKDIDIVLAAMSDKGLIQIINTIYYGHSQTRCIPLIAPDLVGLNGEEIATIEDVICKYGEKTGKWLTEFSHDDTPWKATKTIGDDISYDLVYYRSPVYAVTDQSPEESDKEKEAWYIHSMTGAFSDLDNEPNIYAA